MANLSQARRFEHGALSHLIASFGDHGIGRHRAIVEKVGLVVVTGVHRGGHDVRNVALGPLRGNELQVRDVVDVGNPTCRQQEVARVGAS